MWYGRNDMLLQSFHPKILSHFMNLYDIGWKRSCIIQNTHEFRYMWLFFKKSSFNSPIWQYYVNCFTKKRAKQAYPVLVSPNVFHFAWQTSKTSAPFHIHHSSTFSNSSITIFNALILAYRLSTDSKICQGAYVVLVFWIISLTASSYWTRVRSPAAKSPMPS